MVSSPIFLRARAIAFSLIMLASLVWIVVLCVYMFLEWDISDPAERPIIAVMLLTNTITLIMLLVLLILPFRPWLDAARFLFLMMAHMGVAGAFAFWNPRFHCITSSADAEGVCRLLNMYILLASWIIPVLLIIYVAGLAYAMKRSAGQEPLTPPMLERESILPMMRPGNSRLASYSSASTAEEHRKHISGFSGLSRQTHNSVPNSLARYAPAEIQRKHISGLPASSRTHNSVPNSLTKLPPAFFV
ncbi:hypothetical protein C8R47DRAFT_1104672 [Mycena vitilis]|nr:hypothetical protein C8R47DRAFT_1104672 [Mycena vitilis]